MPFKTLLVVAGIDQSDRDLRTAMDLGREIDAHVSVLVVAVAAPPPVGEYAAVISDPWVEEREADMTRLRERVAAVTSLLAEGDLSSDVTGEYVETAWTSDAVGRRARYADLTVLGPELCRTEHLKSYALDGSLFESGAPVLLVPNGGRPTLKPKRVLVAWDSRLEASRAVRDALPLLKSADDLVVTLVDPEGGERGSGPEPGADIAAYLSRHGAKPRVDRLPNSGRTISEVLRQHAIDIDAQVIVMGAYRHSRLRERIFGGVTYDMIQNAPVPLFMAH